MNSRELNDVASQKKRLKRISGLVFFLVLVVIGRLFYLQIFKHDYYVKIAASQHWAKDTIPASRGKILVKDNTAAGGVYPLADNQKKQLVWAAPEEIQDKNETARKLSPVVGVEEDKLKNLLENNRTYVVLARSLDWDKGKAVEGLQIKGIGLSDEEVRYYPEGTLAAQILGRILLGFLPDKPGKGGYIFLIRCLLATSYLPATIRSQSVNRFRYSFRLTYNVLRYALRQRIPFNRIVLFSFQVSRKGFVFVFVCPDPSISRLTPRIRIGVS